MELIKGIIQNSRFRILNYGLPGIGKSFWANLFPSPVFADLEDGLRQIDCTRTEKIKTYAEFKDACKWFKTSEFKTLVIDTVDILEQLIWKHIIDNDDRQPKSIEDVGGGYGKGYTAAQEEFLRLLNFLDDTNKNIIYIAHSQQKTINEADKNPFDKFLIKMNQKSASLLVARVDAVLFSQWEIRVNKDLKKAVNTERRICLTGKSAAAECKNRFNLEPVEEMNEELIAKIVNFGQVKKTLGAAK